MKRMLINATQAEELRVALVEGQKIYDLDIEVPGKEQKQSNIYKAVVTRIEPSLEAAFVNYGAERHGFLPLKEISREYFPDNIHPKDRPSIKDVVKEGQELIVQVDKEERGNKGAAMTTFITLAGCYLVLMPNNPRAGGISRRIEGEERAEMRDIMSALDIPDDMGVIIRTAGMGRSQEELDWDLDVLKNLWSSIKQVASERKAPLLIQQEGDVIIRALRDYLRPDIGEILVDTGDAFNRAKHYIELIRPDFINRLKRYDDAIPLFNRFQIESQIESAFAREVQLPSGGSIVIDPTEALVSIDINSAKSTKGGDIEETALHTNVEAAHEIARQLRLRDVGGLIVIDFIDMMQNKNQREVENALREALRRDRARVQTGRISRFGLLEMSRQRLRPSLSESSQTICPHCNGQGRVRGVESLALSILRLLEEEALKESTTLVRALVPAEVGSFLLNEKRNNITVIERRHHIRVQIVPARYLDVPQFKIERMRASDLNGAASYAWLDDEPAPIDELPTIEKNPVSRTENAAIPVLTSAAPIPPAPKPKAKPKETAKKPSLFQRLLSVFSGDEEENQSDKPKRNRRNNRGNRNNQNRNRRRRGGQRNRQDDRRRQDNKPAEQEQDQSNKTNQRQGNKRRAPEERQQQKPEQKRRQRRQNDRSDNGAGKEKQRRYSKNNAQNTSTTKAPQDVAKAVETQSATKPPKPVAPKVQAEKPVQAQKSKAAPKKTETKPNSQISAMAQSVSSAPTKASASAKTTDAQSSQPIKIAKAANDHIAKAAPSPFANTTSSTATSTKQAGGDS